MKDTPEAKDRFSVEHCAGSLQHANIVKHELVARGQQAEAQRVLVAIAASVWSTVPASALESLKWAERYLGIAFHVQSAQVLRQSHVNA